MFSPSITIVLNGEHAVLIESQNHINLLAYNNITPTTLWWLTRLNIVFFFRSCHHINFTCHVKMEERRSTTGCHISPLGCHSPLNTGLLSTLYSECVRLQHEVNISSVCNKMKKVISRNKCLCGS